MRKIAGFWLSVVGLCCSFASVAGPLSDTELAGRAYAEKTFGTQYPDYINLDYCDYLIDDYFNQWPKSVDRLLDKDMQRKDRVRGFFGVVFEKHERFVACADYFLRTKLRPTMGPMEFSSAYNNSYSRMRLGFLSHFNPGRSPFVTSEEDLTRLIRQYLSALRALAQAYTLHAQQP
ncbi:hypothetical protein M5M_14357 [Simiduia agarivorans SA1 = DSM 21679]|uniref:Uncharacterized protein n=1 Tax=Simiduia agarivorans (strain DSM 21679 / JCM 13881 / BCRC 17597 / SA1) TaxID=1117647 RepID=R9S570_SIMAS|nr:hypothetical protein M5M_14357 [Simiduia agarivorans SA1 = DSM 21679]